MPVAYTGTSYQLTTASVQHPVAATAPKDPATYVPAAAGGAGLDLPPWERTWGIAAAPAPGFAPPNPDAWLAALILGAGVLAWLLARR